MDSGQWFAEYFSCQGWSEAAELGAHYQNPFLAALDETHPARLMSPLTLLGMSVSHTRTTLSSRSSRTWCALKLEVKPSPRRSGPIKLQPGARCRCGRAPATAEAACACESLCGLRIPWRQCVTAGGSCASRQGFRARLVLRGFNPLE